MSGLCEALIPSPLHKGKEKRHVGPLGHDSIIVITHWGTCSFIIFSYGGHKAVPQTLCPVSSQVLTALLRKVAWEANHVAQGHSGRQRPLGLSGHNLRGSSQCPSHGRQKWGSCWAVGWYTLSMSALRRQKQINLYKFQES